MEEEADETAYWLELIVGGGLLETEAVKTPLREANELTAIMAASRKSASERLQSQIGNRKSQIK